MKSAYELAMERLEEADPTAVSQLTEEQREALAAIDQKYHAKIAEKELFLQQKIADARRNQDAEGASQIEKQLHNERDRLNAEKEKAKDNVRQGS